MTRSRFNHRNLSTTRFTIIGIASIFVAISAIGTLLYLNDKADRLGIAEAAYKTIEVDLNKAKEIFDSEQGIFIDARSPWDYERGHIPGAINYSMGETSQEIDDQIASRLAEELIVVYCAGEGCKTSVLLARYFRDKRGFFNAHAFVGGWPAWVAAGYPIDKETYHE